MQNVKDRYAELHGKFIMEYLKDNFKDRVKVYDVVDSETERSNFTAVVNDEGLYIVSVSPKGSNGDCLYPIYVGYTSRTFGVRFGEHANKEDGVFEKFFTQKKPETTKPCDLHVTVVCCDSHSATLLESVFLKAFDFALNTQENSSERKRVEVTGGVGLDQSKKWFIPAWQAVTQGVSTMIKKTDIIFQLNVV